MKTKKISKFPGKLRELIKQLEMTVEEFASENEVTPPIIYAMFRGRNPSINFIITLSENYPDLDLNWLLRDSLTKEQSSAILSGDEREEFVSLLEKNLDRLKSIIEKPVKKPKK